MSLYSVVEFCKENSKPVEIAATAWCNTLTKNVKWPKTKSQQEFRSLLVARAAPESSWTDYPIRILYQTGGIWIY